MRTLFFVGLLVCVIPGVTFARVGVGVGVGKIQLDEPLRRGGIYELPNLPVINTGTEPGEYEARIEYHHNQPELVPPREWFRFEPTRFILEPGEVQQVKVLLTLPIDEAEPGDYFAYVEGRTVSKQEDGTTHVGVAAAAKLYFSVIPSNKWDATLYRLSLLWDRYSPWPQVVVAVLGLIIFLFVARLMFRRFFSLNLRVKGKESAGLPDKKGVDTIDEEEILRLAEELKKKRRVAVVKRASTRKAATRKTTTRKKPE
ncbi:MAG TPA: hypothetical protein VFE94_03425 [Candidatus Paceibacterota bacterium]|nr:hypothetical protein [Candidatus Paceibacterota bacterium]